MREDVGERTSYEGAASHDDDVFARNFEVAAFEDLLNAVRRAGQKAFFAAHEATEVDRMEAIDIFVGRDAVEGGLFVKAFG